MTFWGVCPDVCRDILQLTKIHVGLKQTSQRKLDSLLAHCPLTGENICFHMFPREALSCSVLTGWRQSWPRQFTRTNIRGWTGGWSDARLLRTAVEDLYLSFWADVRYLAGLPPRFPYRLSPDGLPHFTRDKSGLPAPESVADTLPSCLFSLGRAQF